mmetsp:Transcript_19701/g.28336  ORF Transcript_19701/g.28336 Transcript_19701/m.28336 type:complete len:205 (-) Transcript_19701:323-937(-)
MGAKSDALEHEFPLFLKILLEISRVANLKHMHTRLRSSFEFSSRCSYCFRVHDTSLVLSADNLIQVENAGLGANHCPPPIHSSISVLARNIFCRSEDACTINGKMVLANRVTPKQSSNFSFASLLFVIRLTNAASVLHHSSICISERQLSLSSNVQQSLLELSLRNNAVRILESHLSPNKQSTKSSTAPYLTICDWIQRFDVGM